MIISRTAYSIIDESRKRTTITLDKLTADVLQKILFNVHAWIQQEYDRVAKLRPELSRREKGNIVRIFAAREAQKSPLFIKHFLEHI